MIARDEGWLAEHMLILKLTSPAGESRYIAGAFPSACGKTNLAMVVPSLAGWKVETIGDDICWMKIGSDGHLRAINPEYGFFGVAPGTNVQSNPNAIRMLSSNTTFTNTALTADGDVWWEGLTDEPPEGLTDWRGNPYQADSGEPAAHPNSRFTAPVAQGPVAPEWEDPDGVPISAMLFGGRRASTVPLVYEALDWTDPRRVPRLDDGVGDDRSGHRCSRQAPADPFAMLPFCGYHTADYWAHWLSFAERRDPEKLPRIYSVNWFRKDADGRFLWPGFSENSRVLAWIFDRCAGRGEAVTSPIGHLPAPGALDVQSLALTDDQLATLFRVDTDEWRDELDTLRAHYATFGGRLPSALGNQIDQLAVRLDAGR